jgi:hypothetical protein
MAVSLALQRIYASAPADAQIWETLELRHPLFAKVHYVTNTALAFPATLETGEAVTFETLPFAARQPGSNAGGQQDLALVIDNVDREIIEELERASADPQTRVSVIYRAFASDDLSAPGSDPIALSITEISAGLTTVEATAGRTDVLNKKFPAVLYDIHQFPGLDR